MSAGRPAEAHLLRRGLLGLAGLGIAGTAVELASLRHWGSLEQLIPWAALVLLATATAAVAVGRSPAAVRLARGLAAVSAGGGLYGAIDHIASNVAAGPLDRVYGPKWDSMSTLSHWWAAASGAVGPAPALAPAVLTQIGLCLLLATVAHPVLRAGREPVEELVPVA